MTPTVSGAEGRAGHEADLTGQLVADRYRVERLVATGSRKLVHLGHDLHLQRTVAVCTVRPEHRTPAELERLRAEASVLARLGGHPHVVQVHDLCTHGGTDVLVLQHLPGGTLEDRLARPLPVPEALTVALDVARALDHTHRHGVVHRDVKPENVWIDATGRAMLGDFGLGVLESCATTLPLLGTVDYMSPEQAAGEDPRPADDVYALGALLFRMLTGRTVFPGTDTVDVVRRLLSSPPPAPSSLRPDLPAAVDALVLRLLAAPGRARPTAGVAADALAGLLAPPAASSTAPAGHVREAGALVGRGRELAQLRQHLASAEQGRGAFVVMLGDAGIGKTRTSLALADEATGRGWVTLPGRCHSGDGAPAFWPWTQVLRAAVRAFGDEAVCAHAGAGAALVTELRGAAVSRGGRGLPGDAEHRRTVLSDAVASVLGGLSVRRPVLVVIDDVHWADTASAELLELVAPTLAATRVVLLACGRPDEGAGARAALTRLTARADATVHLGGLAADETRELLEAGLGTAPGGALVQDLHQRTAGNPFYLSEMARLLTEEQRVAPDGTLLAAQVGVPAGLRDVLLRRVSHVSPECADLLRTASVLGREPRLDVLAAVSGRSAGEVMALLDEAVEARLVVALAGLPVRYRFAHALVQEALYDDVPLARRSALHRTAGTALAAVCEAGGDVPPAEVAHHHVRAAADGDVVEAVRWSVVAGDAAAASGGFEDAVAQHARAVHLAASARAAGTAPGLPACGELLLRLGAAHWLAGDAEQARAAHHRAASEALVHGDPELLARAALGLGHGLGGFGFVEHADGELIALLEEALAALPEGDSTLRVRLLSRLATELYFTPFRRRRVDLSARAVEMAARLHDPADEVVALDSRVHALLGPDDVGERRRAAGRIVQLATALGDVDGQFRGHCLRLAVSLETGAADQAAADAAACRRIADEHALPQHRWQAAVFEAAPVLRAGDFDDGRRRADAALALGRRGSRDMASVMWGAQLLLWAWGTGRLDEVVGPVGEFADRYPHAPAWRAAYAFCQLELGRTDAARDELSSCCGADLTGLPRDGNWLTATALLAHVAAGVGDLDRARALTVALRDYADRTVVIAAGAVAFTSVHLPLGALHATLGDTDVALAHLAAAAAEHRRVGALPFVVWTAAEQVRTLLARGGADDHPAAAEVLQEALPLARSLGMHAHVRRLLDVSSRLVAGSRFPAQATAPDDTGIPVTLLLTDVAGSTELTERLGERTAHALLEEHRRLVGAEAGRRGGVVVKSLGDGLLLTFSDAREALECALDIGQAHADAGGAAPLRLRMAVHTGPVLRQRDSLYGLTMIVGARLADAAGAGEVLVSEPARLAASGGRLRFSGGQDLALKGLSSPQRVYRLIGRRPTSR